MSATLEPEWLAHRYDEARDEIRFVHYTRAERAAVPFLVDGHLPEREYSALDRMRSRAEAGSAPMHFVFHSGFCCSTLLAASFDQPGLASTFSEPTILNDAFGWRLRGAAPADLGELMEDALSLLARPFAGDAAVVVKPSTVVNGLAPAILAIRPQAAAIAMHAPLRDFLISIAKKGLEGRAWVRDLLIKCRAERRTEALGFGDLDLLALSDLQVAALDWLMQQSIFARLVVAYPDRVRSLSSADFLAEPRGALAATGKLFGLPVEPAHLDAAMVGPMRRNSKDGSTFAASDRALEYQRAYDVHADEIDKVAAWAAEVARTVGVPIKLDNPLL